MDEQPEGPDLEAAHIEYITGDRPIDEVYETIRDVEQDPIGALITIQQLFAEVARLRVELERIEKINGLAHNYISCYDCRESSMIARAALEHKD
jgi:hypothetical protein